MGKIFYWKGLKFDISNPNVYPPKPASILLAETAIKTIKANEKVLDMCTGCGIVAIAIAKFVKGVSVSSSDKNPEAIDICRRNSVLNNALLKTYIGDLFKPINNAVFDTITIHPPAIPYPQNSKIRIPNGMYLATNGGRDGTAVIRKAVLEAKEHLNKGGRLLLLLPHWSNIKESYKLIKEHYSDLSVLAKKKVEFWLADYAGNESVQYVYQLAKDGIIEIEFKNNRPFSTVSVLQASRD